MTKLKSKKMTKSTFAIIIMAVVMVAMLAFGGTYAYFTAQASAESKEVSTGKIALSNNAVTLVAGPVVPGMDLLEAGEEDDTTDNNKISVTNNSTVDSYIFIKVSVSLENGATVADVLTFAPGPDWQQLTGQTGVYYCLAESDKYTSEIVFTNSMIFDADNNYIDGEYDENSTDANVEGTTISVILQSQSIQAYGFADAAAAYAQVKGFLEPTTGA